eukprot:3749592-Alexandrium_andersonii.AAC.1
MSRALEVYTPAHENWCAVGLHGTKEEYVPSIICEGLSTKHSAGGKLGEKREHIHMVPELLPFGREQPGVRAGSTAIVH